MIALLLIAAGVTATAAVSIAWMCWVIADIDDPVTPEEVEE